VGGKGRGGGRVKTNETTTTTKKDDIPQTAIVDVSK
jgi:hypothetical protein